jgi:hypothetical protein
MNLVWIVIAGDYLYALALAFKAQTLQEWSFCLFVFALGFALAAAALYKDHPIAKKIFEWF